MDDISLSVPRYNPRTGVVAPNEGGTIRVQVSNGTVELYGDPAGLRDLARWCLSLSDSTGPRGGHIHLDPNISPLSSESLPLLIAREDDIDDGPTNK